MFLDSFHDNHGMNQKGFTAVEALLIVIILFILGFAGFYIHHVQKTSSKTGNTVASASSPKTDSKKTTQTYLVIKKWGVQIPLTGSQREANYSYPESDDPNMVELYLPVDGKSQATTSCYGAARIQRITTSSYKSGTWDFYKKTADSGTKFWNIGNYYYMGDSGDIACAGSQTLYNKAEAASAALTQQAAKMTAVH